MDKYIEGEYGISILDALRKSIPISIILSFFLVDPSNEYALVSSLIHLLDVVYSRHYDDEFVYITVRWLSSIMQQSSVTEWHRLAIPCILHFLDIYGKSPLSAHFLQLLLTLMPCISSEERELLNTTYFLPLLLKHLLSSASTSFHTIFSLIDIWASWKLPVVSQLSTEEMGRSLVTVIDSVQWNANYLKQFLHLILALFDSEDHISVFIKSSLFHSLLFLIECHDGALVVVLLQFLNQLLHYHAIHHLLFITDIITICKKQVDMFPRNGELAKAVHQLIQSLANEGIPLRCMLCRM